MYQHDEDLFEHTKMTFGEHLEELRSALFKSAIVIGLGFLLGLSVGKWIVHTLQAPLKDALEGFYQDKAATDFLQLLERRKQQGVAVPEGLDEQGLIQQLEGSRLLPDELWIHPENLRALLQEEGSEQEGSGSNSEYALPQRDEMRRFIIWRAVEDDPRIRVTALNPQEAFIIWIKASLIFGLLVSSPAVFWFIWSFVAAGLYPHEKKYIHIFLPVSVGLFLGGAALAFFAVFQFVLDFLFGINAWLGIDPDPRISEWLSFALFLPVGFGISFQLPLVMLFLERIGVFTVQTYIEKWKIAVLVIAIISMLLTPADPMSMLLMAIPLTVLYFSGIAFCHYLPRSSAYGDEAIE